MKCGHFGGTFLAPNLLARSARRREGQMATKVEFSGSNRKVKGWGLAVILALGVGTPFALPHIFSKGSAAHAAPPSGNLSCVERYNALVKQAKASLVQGDRNGAIHWLLEARTQLDRCQKLDDLNSSEESKVALDGLVTGQCQPRDRHPGISFLSSSTSTARSRPDSWCT
jgi:hypothetical protein